MAAKPLNESDAPSSRSVGRVLQALRLDARLSQQELAERLGVVPDWVIAREESRSPTDVAAFIDWCRACGVAPEVGLERLLASSI